VKIWRAEEEEAVTGPCIKSAGCDRGGRVQVKGGKNSWGVKKSGKSIVVVVLRFREEEVRQGRVVLTPGRTIGEDLFISDHLRKSVSGIKYAANKEERVKAT